MVPLFFLFIAIAVSMVVGFVVGFQFGDKRFFGREINKVSQKAISNRHEHIWVVVSTEQYKQMPSNYDKRNDHRPVWIRLADPVMNKGTRVLHKCFCGETKVENLTGHWTREELTA